MALALHEDEESYRFLYTTVKEALLKHYGFDFQLQPSYSLTDNHRGQLKAIQEVFHQVIMLRCFFHLLQNINRLVN